jgi:hypothetical protein
MPTRRGTVSIDDMSDNNDLLLASFKAMLDIALQDHRNIFEAQFEEAEEVHRQQRDEDWEAIQNLHATHRSIMNQSHTQQQVLLGQKIALESASTAFEFAPATPRSTDLHAVPVHQQPMTPPVFIAPVPQPHTAVPVHSPHTVAPVPLPHQTAAAIPRIIFSEKMNWPTISNIDDYIQLQGWRAKFLSTLTGCDLADLYNPATRDLHLTTTDDAMKKRLHKHLCGCLPDSHPMVRNDAYFSDGLSLWHDFTATIKQQPSYQLRRQLHTTFLTSTTRSDKEDIFTYYSRLLSDVARINEGQETPVITSMDLRQQFLLTLGPEFNFITEAINEQRLDPTYLSNPIQTLLQKLQGILTTKKENVLKDVSTTSSTAGYAYAAVRVPQTVRFPSVRSVTNEVVTNELAVLELAVMNQRLEALTDVMTNVVNQVLATSSRTQPSPQRARTPPPSRPTTPTVPSMNNPVRPKRIPKYCWTHGEVGHSGVDCRNPSANHDGNATHFDRRGGSDFKTIRRS